MSTDARLEMNVHLLGLLGLIVLKVKLLEILKRVCECQVPNPAEGRNRLYSLDCANHDALFFHSVFRDLRRSGSRVHETWQIETSERIV